MFIHSSKIYSFLLLFQICYHTFYMIFTSCKIMSWSWACLFPVVLGNQLCACCSLSWGRMGGCVVCMSWPLPSTIASKILLGSVECFSFNWLSSIVSFIYVEFFQGVHMGALLIEAYGLHGDLHVTKRVAVF